MKLPAMWRRGRPLQSRTKSALIVGPYRVHNFGDDLIGAVLAKRLQQQGYDVTIPRLGAENARWLGTHFADDYAGQFEKADLVVVGGGGIMSDTSGAKPGASYLRIVSQAAAAGRLDGKRLVVSGVGAGPWIRDASRSLALEIAGHAERLGVRDIDSRDYLHGIGVPAEKVVTGADIALLTSDYLAFRRRRTRRIGLQFDIAQFEDVQQNPQISAIADSVAAYARTNASRVVLISNGRHRSQIAEAAPSCDLLRYATLRDFLPRLSGLSAIFTSHLHLAITAYSQRIPSFSLYVREKTKRFYEQIGHPERALDLRSATPEDFERFIAAAETAQWTDGDEANLKDLKFAARKILDIVG